MFRSLHTSHVAALSVTLTLLASSCGGTAPAAPYGLELLRMPEGSEQIGSALSKMPGTLQGLEANRTSDRGGKLTLSYGEERGLSIGAVDWSRGEGGFPAQTAGDLLPRLAESGEIDVNASDLDGDLLWFSGENHELNEQGEVIRTIWTMWWGSPASGWVFAVNAPSEEDGVALVPAFVEAAS
jgi:hypothetical protein